MLQWLAARMRSLTLPITSRLVAMQKGAAGPPALSAARGNHRRARFATRSADPHRGHEPADTAIASGAGSAARPRPPVWPPSQNRPRGGGPRAEPAPSAGRSLAADGAPAAAGQGVRPAATRSYGGPSGAARAAVRTRAAANGGPRAARREAAASVAGSRPWYETRPATRTAPGMRHCGLLEAILHREWAGGEPSPAIVTAIQRLAELPQLIKEKLVAGLDAIHVGAGGVPDLDDMARLRGIPLPSGRATWDACAGAYGARKIIVGSRLSPTPDVMCHEIGHALDDIDGPGDQWQSDLPEFHRLYGHCRPRLASPFHQEPGALGRREFFADAFAAIASGQRPALVEMLGGDTRSALDVMLYFNVRYGL